MKRKIVYLYKACDKGGRDGYRSGAEPLVEQLQHGDLTTLGILFEQHKDMVYRTAFAITRDEKAADDILQECFVRLYTYRNSVDSSRPLKPWLYRVTVNLAYDWSAKAKVGQSLDDVLEWLTGLPGTFSSPDRKTEEKEMMQMVQDVVAGLPTPHRAVIVLFYIEGLSVEEIAGVLELPVGTVKSRLHYARGRLRKALARRQRPVPEMAYEFT
jgi:RNA polymerase sigma-70 factor (ECF subfamily)